MLRYFHDYGSKPLLNHYQLIVRINFKSHDNMVITSHRQRISYAGKYSIIMHEYCTTVHRNFILNYRNFLRSSWFMKPIQRQWLWPIQSASYHALAWLQYFRKLH